MKMFAYPKNNESFMSYGTRGYFNSEDVLTQP